MAVLVTDRLMLSELTLGDARDVFEVRGDPEAMAYWDWPADPDPDATRAVVAELIRDMSAGHALYWTLRCRSDGAFVGLCDLSELSAGDSADIGFVLVRRRWGHGLAYEAVIAVVDHARDIGLRTLHARVHTGNARSVRLLERAGFREVSTSSAFEIRPGVFRDCRRFKRLL